MQKADDIVKRATEADEQEKYEEAITLYNHAVECFLYTLKCKCLRDRYCIYSCML